MIHNMYFCFFYVVSKHYKRSVDVMTSFLGDISEQKEKAADRRHKEKMETMNSFINVMKDFANK